MLDVHKNFIIFSNIEVNRIDLFTELPNVYIANTNLPTCNREATNVKNIYNIYDIIPKSKLETLYDQAVEILKGAIEGKPKFFTRILRTIDTIGSRQCEQNCSVALY